MGPISALSWAQPIGDADSSTNRQSLTDAVEFLNKRNAVGPSNEIIVTQNPEKRGLVVQVVDRETRTVVRQLSPASIFNLVNRHSR
jgi:uncharacterized FlaG/YvyC family protein